MTAPEGYVLTDEGLRLYYRIVGDGPEQVIIPLASSLSDDCDPLVDGRTLIFTISEVAVSPTRSPTPNGSKFAHERSRS